ncbi:nucleotidyltransferase family protein [Bradyrhizobium sp.]|uniref:nucleotidyltransferase domain-containing protein n=1 Tax=Bradyrhizobium sp. TaxID=376 RepID=UPI002734881E|nr:nucleotidyltransferase family protein [Bradyrhizobium sp.]
MTRWQVFEELCGLLRAGLRGTPPKLTDDPPWDQLIQASSYHGVTPFLAWSLRDHREIDPAAAEYLTAILALNTLRNRQLTLVMGRVAQALNTIDIVPVFFKGAAYLAGSLYPDQGMRFTGDIDLLLPGGRAPDISRVLMDAGFDGEQARLLVRTKSPFLPHFRDRETGAILDTHQAIAPQEWQAICEPVGFEARCRLVEVGGARVRIPNPTDLIAHSIVHNQLKDRYYQRETVHLRQLLDLDFLCDRHASEIDWMDLEGRFESTGTASALSSNFHFVETLLHRNAPKFNCPPRPLALELLRRTIENPGRQRQFLMSSWVSQYVAGLRARPLSVLNLLNAKIFVPRLRRLYGIVRDRKW